MNIKAFTIFATTILAIFVLTGIGSADEWKDESGKSREQQKQHEYDEGGKNAPAWNGDQGEGGESYFRSHGYERLDIPPGHYPAPGECRIWFPNRPAGQQPAPGSCRQLERMVPPGAWLITHPMDRKKHVHVTVFDDFQPGRIRAVGEFDIGSGMFVRIVLDH